jgi:hypothetical protein
MSVVTEGRTPQRRTRKVLIGRNADAGRKGGARGEIRGNVPRRVEKIWCRRTAVEGSTEEVFDPRRRRAAPVDRYPRRRDLGRGDQGGRRPALRRRTSGPIIASRDECGDQNEDGSGVISKVGGDIARTAAIEEEGTAALSEACPGDRTVRTGSPLTPTKTLISKLNPPRERPMA